MENNRVIIFDTTLRDGEQTPGVSLNITEKLDIARQLEKMGVDIIEAGFPATSPGDFQAVEAIGKEVNCTVAALCRCVTSDIQSAMDALKDANKPRIHLVIATSDLHMEAKLRMTPEKVTENAIKAIQFARTFCDDVEFSCEDASRSNPAFLYKIVEAAITAGATTINIPDTVGYAIPEEFGQLINGIMDNVPNVNDAIISVHCHDDLGMAVANSLAALQNGARQVEVSVNGIGERAGNCSFEEIIMAITTRGEYLNLTHGIDTTKITRISQRVSKFTNVPVSEYKSIVGKNAFAHESGIHQHGMLMNPMTYEIMTPESVGKKESTLVLGKHSGSHAFEDRLITLGYTLTKEELAKAFVSFKELADSKKNITDEDLEALVSQKVADIPELCTLETFQIQTGNTMESMASVTINYMGKQYNEAATGGGPIDAAFNAIMRIMEEDITLESYKINAVTSGEDALGEVTARIKKGNRLYTGKGLASDIIESSIRAFVDGVNRMLAEEAAA